MRNLEPAILVVPILAALACTQPATPPTDTEADVTARAQELAKRIPIVDTHVDLPWRLEKDPEDVSQRAERGDIDYPRAIEGGLDLPFLSIYVPAELQGTGEEKAYADGKIDLVERLAADHPDKFVLVTRSDEVASLPGSGKVGLAMGMENGAPILELADLRHYYDRGIRYITLTHGENNQICDSSYAKERTWNGLSPFGREVVAEMNRLGILIDISHLSDDAADQVLDLSTVPVIASHSSCRHFTPGWERNMSDELIAKLAERGGVIQINFGSAFLTDEARRQSTAFWDARGKYMADHELEDTAPEVKAFEEEYWSTRDKQYADLSDVVDHIDHVVELAGVEHVGFGSDFDGVGDSLPTGLKDVSDYPNLIRALLERGYSEEDVERIAGGNLLRVWRTVEAAAE